MKVLKMKRNNCPPVEITNPSVTDFETIIKSANIAYQLHDLTYLEYRNVPAVEAPEFRDAVISMMEG